MPYAQTDSTPDEALTEEDGAAALIQTHYKEHKAHVHRQLRAQRYSLSSNTPEEVGASKEL